MPAARASLASVAKRCGAGDLADELGRGQRPETGLGEQVRRDLGDEVGDLGLERVDRRRSARAGGAARRGRSARASSARRARGAGRSASLHFFENSAPPGSVSSGQRSCRCHCSVLLSATRVRTRRSRWSTSRRMSSSGPASAAVGNVSMPSRQRRARDRERVDRSDLPRSRLERRDAGHQPGRDANDALAARDQEPLQRAARHAGSPPAPTPARHRGRAPRSPAPRTREHRPRPSCRRAPDPSQRRPPRPCASACGCPPRARS